MSLDSSVQPACQLADVAAPASAARWAGRVAMLVVVAATALMSSWHLDRTYWNDEAWGIDFALQPTMGKTLQAAVDMQLPGAPGYLIALHGAGKVQSAWPWVFHIPSIVLGLLLMAILALQAQRFTGNLPLACAVPALLLACPFLQRYITEAKQYSADAAFTTGIIVLTAAWLRRPGAAMTALFTVWAALGVTMSFACWFALPPAFLTLAAAWWKKKDKAELIRIGVAGVALALVGALAYFGYARRAASGQGDMGFWQSYFLPRDLAMPKALWNHWTVFFTAAWQPYSVPPAIMLGVSLAGLGVWVWRDRVTGGVAVGTLLVTILASMASVWPMAVRTNLAIVVILHLAIFAIPCSMLGWWLGRKSGAMASPPGSNNPDPPARTSWPAYGGLAATVVAAALSLAISRGLKHEPSNIRALLAKIATMAGPDDLVILDWAAEVNQRIEPAAIQGRIHSGGWTNMDTVVADYGSLMLGHRPGRSWLVSSMDNHEREWVWTGLAAALTPHGSWTKAWASHDRRIPIAIYVFERREK